MLLKTLALSPAAIGLGAWLHSKEDNKIAKVPKEFKHFLHPRSKIKINDHDGSPLLADIGTISSVYINKKKNIVRKYFSFDMKTCGNTYPKYSNQKTLDSFLAKEVETLKKLHRINSPFCPKLISVSLDHRYFEEEYLGEDSNIQLYDKRLLSSEESIKELFFQSLLEYKKIGVFKLNLGFSNYVINEDKKTLKAIDFKWCYPRKKELLELQLDAIVKVFGKNFTSSDFSKLELAFSDFKKSELRHYLNSLDLIKS